MYVVVALLVRLGVNILALIVINWLFSSVTISGWWSFFIGALVLTIVFMMTVKVGT